jgi:copper(I)-binding protein
MRILSPLALAGALTLASLSSLAHEYGHGHLTIGHPWSRATPPGAPTAGGYMTVENRGREPDRLLGGTTPAAGRVEIHEMTVQDGIMRMRPLSDGLPIPAQGSVVLEPGGYHLMFIALERRLKEGDEVAVTLHFEKAGEVDVVFRVEAPGTGGTARHGAGHAADGEAH